MAAGQVKHPQNLRLLKSCTSLRNISSSYGERPKFQLVSSHSRFVTWVFLISHIFNHYNFPAAATDIKKRDEERLDNTKASESATGRENYILLFTFTKVPNTNNYL